MTPAERAKTVETAIARGQQQERAGDFGAAVVSYNEALRLDPANLDAKSGLNQAAAAYKAQKSERDALESIKTAFKDGEYTAGLRMAYRLPPTIDRSYVDAVKMAGWYNLGIVALRAGDCREAMAHMSDALEIDPDDERALELKTFAERYLNAPKDRSFLDQAEAMAFRPLPATPGSLASR
jgi:Tfp pilus assembly protein PilF